MHARASVGRRSRETRETRAAAREEKIISFVVPFLSHAFSHARGHLRVSDVLLDRPRKKRGCSYSTEKCLKNSIIRSFCHNFDRFKSNIRTSYVTLCLFLFHTRVSNVIKSVTFFNYFFYDFTLKVFFSFPWIQIIWDKRKTRRRRKEIEGSCRLWTRRVCEGE